MPSSIAVVLRCASERSELARGVVDLLRGQNVDRLLAVRVAGEEAPDPVDQSLLLSENVGLMDIQHGWL